VENSFELRWIDVLSMIFSDPIQGLVTPVCLLGYKSVAAQANNRQIFCTRSDLKNTLFFFRHYYSVEKYLMKVLS